MPQNLTVSYRKMGQGPTQQVLELLFLAMPFYALMCSGYSHVDQLNSCIFANYGNI